MDPPDRTESDNALKQSEEEETPNDDPYSPVTYNDLFSNNANAGDFRGSPVELFINSPSVDIPSSSTYFSLSQPSRNRLSSLAAASATSSITLDPRVPVQPVSRELVEQEAEPIFVNFIQERFLVDQTRENIPSSFPSPTLRRNNSSLEMSIEEQRVAHRLVELSDFIDREHGTDFNVILSYLGATSYNVSDHFIGVANSLFKDGDRNWGRVVALFYLGYRMGLECLRRGLSDVLYRLGDTFLSILRNLNLVEWVAQRGGWRTVLLLAYNCVETIPTFYSGAATVTGALLLTWFLSYALGFGRRS